MQALLHSVIPTLHQATTNPHLPQRLLDTHEQVWVSVLWGHCCFLLGPDECKVLFVPFKSLFSQPCVSSGGSIVGLMASCSKRAYSLPRSTAPRALPLQQSAPDLYLLRRYPNTVLSQCLWDLCVLVHTNTRYVWALWVSLADMGFDSKRDFAPPTILLGLLLCPGHGISPHRCSSAVPPLLQHRIALISSPPPNAI